MLPLGRASRFYVEIRLNINPLHSPFPPVRYPKKKSRSPKILSFEHGGREVIKLRADYSGRWELMGDNPGARKPYLQGQAILGKPGWPNEVSPGGQGSNETSLAVSFPN